MEGECVTKESRLQRGMNEIYQEETTVQLAFSRARQCQLPWDVLLGERCKKKRG